MLNQRSAVLGGIGYMVLATVCFAILDTTAKYLVASVPLVMMITVRYLLQAVLSKVELAYQNLDSVELGVTTIDTYFDTLGGISRAVKRAKSVTQGADAKVAPVYIGDQTHDAIGGGTVRTLGEQVALETRTRMLNPKWYEGMLKHGYEGVRQIEVHVTNTMGWSATTGGVSTACANLRT